ncbi:hypothetical protein A2U01_0015572 [Trifolium medium]|uniref:Uncharacterized protein n=1 Tax=Trifolium medium TaxID=97028 RepID=A0A392N620_9FABA|nr:hypothetical protein [Trifolium medium]
MGNWVDGTDDSWSWRYDPSENYYVQSAYLMLTGGRVANDLNFLGKGVGVLGSFKSDLWQLIQNRVTSRQNLLMRRVTKDTGDTSCVLCGEILESV